MTYLMSAVLGFVQGVAEFLPISSSGHLTLFQHFFGMEEPDNLFNILLHFATLIAVCIYYFQDVLEMIVEFFRGMAALFSRSPSHGNPPEARRLVLLIIVGTLPLFLVLPFESKVEAFGSNPIFVCCALLITGCILFFSDRLSRGRKTAKNTKLTDGLLIGCAQAVAVIPGISRSGATISAGMMLGLNRDFAVRYSFLLSLPAIVGANILELKDALEAENFAETVVPLLPVYLVGVLVAAVVGYFAIRLVKSLADKGKFGKFAYYCWAVGAVSLVAGILKFYVFA